MKNILAPGTNCYGIDNAIETGLLIDGRDYYRAFWTAAENAEHYILLSGWQFDSDVQLVRGKDRASGETTLLSFLNRLCENKPELRIYILAWNFSMIYLIDREWLQRWYFKWNANERIHFCFDSYHPFGASHHQKFTVIDGRLAFLGGLDICSGRWDERDHRAINRLRHNTNGCAYPPFHDVQTYHLGTPAERLAKFFQEQWSIVCGSPLDLPPPAGYPALRFCNRRRIDVADVALSRTQVKPLESGNETVREIRRLFRDAVDAAEELIYIENQYFSSHALCEALLRRMRARNRPRLAIVLMLAKEANAFVEQASIGIVQAKLLRQLRQVAQENGHQMGVFYPASQTEDGEDVPTYIHSKLVLVDDEFLSVGSANMNNRSMGLDTELNVSWQARRGDDDARRSIRAARLDLLVEHTGVADAADDLVPIQGLVSRLEALAENPASRLRMHPLLNGALETESWLETFFPDGLPLDPEGPVFGEDTYEDLPADRETSFPRGINWLSHLLSKKIE